MFTHGTKKLATETIASLSLPRKPRIETLINFMRLEFFNLGVFISYLTLAQLLIAGHFISQRPQLDCLTRAVYHEAKGEAPIGKLAVAHVVLNRLKHAQFPDTICKVVYQPAQFSGINLPEDLDPEQWVLSHKISVAAMFGFTMDPTGGAEYFYAPAKVRKPSWAYKFKETVQVGGHLFFNSKQGT